MRRARLFRLPRAHSRLITWSDLTLAALIGFVSAPIALALSGAALTALLPHSPVSNAISTAASILAVSTPVALFGSIPGIVLARFLARVGWIGPLSIIAAGGLLASIPGLGNVSVSGMLVGFGFLYAGLSWLALRLLRRDVFVVSKENHTRDEVSPFD